MNVLFIIYSVIAFLSFISLVLLQLNIHFNDKYFDYYEEHAIGLNGLSIYLLIQSLGMGLFSILYWSLYFAL